MAMTGSDIEKHLLNAFPDAKIEIVDMAGDGNHYSATVTSEAFRGINRVAQHKKVYEALEGAMDGALHALALTTRIPGENPDQVTIGDSSETTGQHDDWIDKAVNAAPVILMMKGNRQFPRCGFSATVVQILDHLGVNYQTHDILMDESLRQGLKQYSNWPTFPQLYIHGNFVGGCDIVKEMFEGGELRGALQHAELI